MGRATLKIYNLKCPNCGATLTTDVKNNHARCEYCGNEFYISEKTAKQIAILMRLNVTEGANKKAEVKGYQVGGKSGTAEKLNRGRYSKTANYTGFIGAFPMPNPEYSVYVVLDEPQATAKTHGFRTAGWIAAPTAANIIQRIGPMLNESVLSRT